MSVLEHGAVVIDVLARKAAAAARPGGAAWLDTALADVRIDPAELAARSTAASRAVGKAPLPPFFLAGYERWGWAADDAARGALLATVAEAAPSSLERAVEAVYRGGDHREKAAVLRTLSLLPDPGRFVELARDAGRTNDVELFTALACDNPYPGLYYDDEAFDRLVMKAVYLDLPLHRVVRLGDRIGPELVRMAMDFRRERERAGRALPTDLWILLDPRQGGAA